MTEPMEGGAAPAPVKANPFERLVGVLFSPGETFRGIAERPDWVVALLLFVAISIASTMIVVPKLDLEGAVRDQMAKSGREVDEKQLEVITSVQKPIIYTTGVVGVPVYILVIALVYMLGFKAFGGEGTFKQYFSVALYSWVPLMLFSVIALIVAMTRSSLKVEDMQTMVMSNLGFLANPLENPARFALLSSIDVFTFWVLALLVIGLGIVSRLPKSQSIGIVIVIWLVYVIGKVGLAAVGQMMSSGAGGGA